MIKTYNKGFINDPNYSVSFLHVVLLFKEATLLQWIEKLYNSGSEHFDQEDLYMYRLFQDILSNPMLTSKTWWFVLLRSCCLYLRLLMFLSLLWFHICYFVEKQCFIKKYYQVKWQIYDLICALLLGLITLLLMVLFFLISAISLTQFTAFSVLAILLQAL